MTNMQFNYWLLHIKNIINSCNQWFLSILFESGTFSFYLSIITIFLFVRFLIVPFVGSAISTDQSDKVKPARSDKAKSAKSDKAKPVKK